MTTDDYPDTVRPLVSTLNQAGCEDTATPPGTPLTKPQREALIALALAPGHYGVQYGSAGDHPASYRGPRAIFAAVKTDELRDGFYVIASDGTVRSPGG